MHFLIRLCFLAPYKNILREPRSFRNLISMYVSPFPQPGHNILENRSNNSECIHLTNINLRPNTFQVLGPEMNFLVIGLAFKELIF